MPPPCEWWPMTGPRAGARRHAWWHLCCGACERREGGIEEIALHLTGHDPRETDRIYDAMDEVLVGRLHAKAAIDIACWDLTGKALSLPVCKLLGGSTGVPMGTICSIYPGKPFRCRTPPGQPSPLPRSRIWALRCRRAFCVAS
jgi:L-alanine-DL-glutamate epimerase-like enolase superfamily enzyme